MTFEEAIEKRKDVVFSAGDRVCAMFDMGSFKIGDEMTVVKQYVSWADFKCSVVVTDDGIEYKMGNYVLDLIPLRNPDWIV